MISSNVVATQQRKNEFFSAFAAPKFGTLLTYSYLCSGNKKEDMGQLAFLKMFILVAISLDVNDNRRHVHVFWKGKRHQHSLAKIWIEKNGEQCVEIAESELSAKDNEMLVAAINRHWKFINEQITRTFNGEKTIAINIEK